MDLDEQIQLLIDHAPQDGSTPQALVVIAPVLKLLAGQLRHLQYCLLQSPSGDWVLTTLSNRANPAVEKRVVYAFPTLKVPSTAAAGLDRQIIVAPVPVTHILFQLVALETVDSVVFFETPGQTTKGTEIQRQHLQDLIQAQLDQYPVAPIPTTPPNRLPPDIA